MSTIPSKANPAHVALGTDLVPASDAAGSLDVSLSLNQIAVAVSGAQGVLTVGANAQYSTLQLALDAVRAAGNHFTAVQDTYDGIMTFTQGSRTVTGDANTFITYVGGINRMLFISAEDPAGPNVKWYKVRFVISEDELVLDVPFEETTKVTAANAWWFGDPNITTVAVLEDIDEQAYYNATGAQGGGTVQEIALNVSFPNKTKWNGELITNVKSGILYIEGSKADEGSEVQFRGLPADSVLNAVFKNVYKRSMHGVDFIWFETGNGLGSCTIIDSFMWGNFDLLIPAVKGSIDLLNTPITTVPLNNLTTNRGGGARGVSNIFNNNSFGVLVNIKNSPITVHSHGVTAGLDLAVLRLTSAVVSAVGGNVVTVENSPLTLNGTFHSAVATEGSFVRLGCENSDITFINSPFIVNGVSVIPANWRSILRNGSLVATTPNRIRMINSALPKRLESDLATGNIATLDELTGSTGGSLDCTVATIDTDEYDLLRAHTYILDGLDAAKTIPVIKNPVEGEEITFVLKEDGTAGHAITWNAVYHFTQGGWTDSIVTTDANKVSTVKFKYMGTAWYETSPANGWTS